MLKVGIVGSGFGLYGLLPAFRGVNGCRVVSIAGKNTPRLLDYCASIGLQNIYTDWRLMLAHENLDAVAIAVVPATQYTVAKTAIKKGLHVFAEKPLAVNSRQAKELLTLAKKHRVAHGMDFIFPEIPAWQEVKKKLKENRYGKLKYISSNWDFLSYDIKNKLKGWKTDASAGGGALSFYFSHVLYYLEYFTGPIVGLASQLTYSRASRNGGDTGVDVIVRFKKGAHGYAHLSCNAPDMNQHEILLVFEKAAIVLSSENGSVVNFSLTIHQNGKIKKWRPAKIARTARAKQGIKNGEDERVAVVRRLAERFIKACRGGRAMVPSFADGVRVQELIEMIRRQQ